MSDYGQNIAMSEYTRAIRERDEARAEVERLTKERDEAVADSWAQGTRADEAEEKLPKLRASLLLERDGYQQSVLAMQAHSEGLAGEIQRWHERLSIANETSDDAIRARDELSNTCDKLEIRIARLEEALRFYADDYNYWPQACERHEGAIRFSDGRLIAVPIMTDSGRRARQALADKGG